MRKDAANAPKHHFFVGQPKNLPGILTCLALAGAINIVFAYTYPLLGILLKDRGLVDEEISGLFSFAESGEFVMLLLLPLFIRHVSVKQIAILSSAAMGAAVFCLSQLSGDARPYYPTVFMLNFNFYLLALAMGVSCNKWADPAHRGGLMGLLMAVSLGGAIIGSAILKWAPKGTALFLWGSALLLAVSAIQLGLPFLSGYKLVQGPPPPLGQKMSVSYFTRLKDIMMLTPLVLVALVLVFIGKTVSKGIMDSLSVYDVQVHLASLAGVQILCLFVGSFIMALVIGRLFDRSNHYGIMAGVYALSGAAFIWLEFDFVDNLYLQALAFLLIGPSIFGSYTLCKKVLGDRLEPEKIALGSNLTGLFGAVFCITAPSFFGIWLTKEGTVDYFWPFIFLLTFGAGTMLISAWKIEKKQRCKISLDKQGGVV